MQSEGGEAGPGGPGPGPEPKGRKRAHWSQPVQPEVVATYTAARLFLLGEWVGALLLVGSFTELYLALFAFGASGPVAIGIGLGMLVLGAWMFWTNRTYYLRLDFPWRRGWEVAATIVGGSGVVFWLLFLLLAVLVWNGIPVQGE